MINNGSSTIVAYLIDAEDRKQRTEDRRNFNFRPEADRPLDDFFLP